MILRRLPSLPTWSTATRELDTVRREMERLFDSLGDFAGARLPGVFPAINVTEDAEAFHVRAELPGFDKDRLGITVENKTLTISGEREAPEPGENVSFHRREREFGKFRRSFTLNAPIEADKVQARYRDGLLTVSLPKSVAARPRQIAVQAGA